VGDKLWADRPWWVRIVLVTARSRAAALAWAWMNIAMLAIVALALFVVLPVAVFRVPSHSGRLCMLSL
jgi:hypothetical protein